MALYQLEIKKQKQTTFIQAEDRVSPLSIEKSNSQVFGNPEIQGEPKYVAFF